MSTHALKVEPEHNQIRLDIFLTQTLPERPSRSFVKKLIESQNVRINGKVFKAHYKVCEGEEVVVHIPENLLEPSELKPENIPLDIFYEDDHLIVVNKPSGMLVHPAQGCYTGTLVNALLYYSNKLSDFNTDFRPGIVHRLDQETSGLILIAKDNIAHTKLAKQFKKRKVQKRYVALVEGEVEFDEGIVEVPIGRDLRHREKRSVQFDEAAKEAVTFYRVIKRHQGITFVALYPKTGRTHQLRVHMKYIKHPILGDEKYGKKITFSRLALHAQSIGFTHPEKKCYLEFSSIPPSEFFEKVKIER